jgi:CubicO group peptidase (beta-lactamase class C family)
MQLVEQGLLDLDADIHMYLPEDLSRQFNFERSFTVRDLINHSAGFGEFFFNAFLDAEKIEDAITLREGLLSTRPGQIFEPGTASSYSNFGNALAAYVVSHISGLEFAAFERENILTPLGMTNTKNQPDWFHNNEFLQSKARGYMHDGSGGFHEAPWWHIPIYPAGALNGTAEDLARLAIALTPPHGQPSPLFTTRDTLDLMLSPSYLSPSIMRGTNHGFLSYDGIYTTLGHNGGTGGFYTEFVMVPSERFGVVLLTNANAGGAVEFIDKVLDLLLGNSKGAVTTPVDLPNAGDVAGDYVSLRRHEGNILELSNFLMAIRRVDAIDENTIAISGAAGTAMIYQQIEPYTFRFIGPDEVSARTNNELHFIMENGKPVGISMTGPSDATVQTFGQSMNVFTAGLEIAAISVVFFLIMPIIILIGFLCKKEKKAPLFNRISNGLLFSGTLLTLNNLVLVLRVLSDFSPAGPFVQSSVITPHVWINYILLALIVILFIISIVFFKRDKVRTVRKVLYFATATLMTLFIFVLWHWNFFVMM